MPSIYMVLQLSRHVTDSDFADFVLISTECARGAFRTLSKIKNAEAATSRVLLKMVFLKISQYSLKRTCVGVSF